jgi:hypothetical protein
MYHRYFNYSGSKFLYSLCNRHGKSYAAKNDGKKLLRNERASHKFPQQRPYKELSLLINSPLLGNSRHVTPRDVKQSNENNA